MIRPRSKAALIARLREGELPTDDYYQFAKTKQSLRVRIHNLRDEGYKIVLVANPKSKGGISTKLYRLTDAPAVCCSHCGSAL